MGHSPQLSGQHGSHVFQSCVVSFKCVLDFQVVSCIIIIIALFFQSCVVSFKCVLDFQVVSCIIIIIALFFQSCVVSFKCVLDFQVVLCIIIFWCFFLWLYLYFVCQCPGGSL